MLSKRYLEWRYFGGKLDKRSVETLKSSTEVMTESVVAGEWSGSGESDGEGEPLFADDLEDLPPLPPPMPSLSQLQDEAQAQNIDQSADNAATAQDNQASTNQGPPQKKRKPMLTLTMDRVFSEKGLPYVEAEFPKLKFKGKRHEVSDLKCLLQQYEHWANMMYPKLTFKDVMLRIQRLSTTREFKMQITGMRRRHARGGIATPPLVDSDDEDHPVQQSSDSRRSRTPINTHTLSPEDHTHTAGNHVDIDNATSSGCGSPCRSLEDIHEAVTRSSAPPLASDEHGSFLDDHTSLLDDYTPSEVDHNDLLANDGSLSGDDTAPSTTQMARWRELERDDLKVTGGDTDHNTSP